jgi:hypothetical protein
VLLEVVPSLSFAPRKSHAKSVYTDRLFVNEVVGSGLTPLYGLPRWCKDS